MIRLIIFLIVATAVALVAVFFANNPGHVAISWNGRVVEMSVGLLLLVFLAVAVVFAVVVEIVRALRGLPRRVRVGRARSRRARGYRALTTGLIAAASGNLARARALLHESERLLPREGSVLLLAAQTAQLEGKEEIAHLKFRQMLAAPETELMGLRGLLGQAAKADDRAEALDLAERAYRRSPGTPWVTQTLFDLRARAERWPEAKQLLPELVKLRQIDEPTARRRAGLLEHLIGQREAAAGNTREALAHARRAVRLVPGFAPIAVATAELAKAAGRNRLARKTLEACWQTAPHPELARAYAGLVDNEQPAERLKRFEKRLKPLRPDHAELDLALGEIALAARQFDDARRHLERATTLEPGARAFRLRAELERATGAEPARVQEFLARAAEASADRAWVCDDTAEVLPAWQPFGNSGRFDAVHWGLPPKLATLVGREHGPFISAEIVEAPQADANRAESNRSGAGRDGQAVARSDAEMAPAS